MTVTIEEASTQLALLIEKAASGEDIIIARDGSLSIRLMPLPMSDATPADTAPLKPRVPGLGKGQVWMSPDFNDPMPDDWLDEFYSGEVFPCKPS